MSGGRRVLVVGGGVAGLCTAYYLAKRGAEVTVVESNRVGSGASAGNGGWLCPAQAGPLPEPGLTLMGMRALLNRDSALYLNPSKLRNLAPWLLRFWSYCNPRAYRHGLTSMARLGGRVFELVEGMVDDGVEFDLYRQGMLIASHDPVALRAELAKLRPMEEFGYELPADLVSDEELWELEPALSDNVHAGFLINQHWHVRPESFNRGIAAAARALGVEVLEGAEVVDFQASGPRVRSIRTAAGDLEGDKVVVAAGSWTPALLAQLGVDVPVQAGKGYSFMVSPSVVPRHAVLLADVHVGCTPFGDQMRIGGTMEFSGVNLHLDRHRIDQTIAGARASFREWMRPEVESEWAGMRPIAPDGLPVLDRAAPYENLYVATGYSMQGMTLGPPAGDAIAEFITTGRRPSVLEPFTLDRFSRFPRPRRRYERDGS
ncbi:MAG: FAD-dependent oxidoreductase [Actinobacteria bacterium]|nr:FAD-dependent oxidoreductase [Actinomycetota bacterium]MBS1882873.1 FAD-dependent oxidoreductase [Actinomycetota bacterium]